MVNNIPVNGWPRLKDLEAVQPTLDRLDKIEAWKRTVKEETFTGDDITIENALALPARSLITEINAIQDLHGYDKPWAGGAYKNQFDIDNPQSSSGWTISSGVLTGNNNNYAAFISNKFKGNGTMWLSEKVTASTADYVIQVRNVTDNVEVNRWTISAGSGQSLANTFNAVSGKEYEVRYFGTSATSGTISISEIQVEEGTTATSYAPYSNICPIGGRDSVVLTRSDGDEISEDFTIQLGQTVYGADINWDTGVLTPKTTKIVIDGNSNIFTDSGTVGNTAMMRLNITPQAKAYGDFDIRNMKASYLTPTSSNALFNRDELGITTNTAGAAVWFRLPNIKTVADAKTYLTSNPLQVEYELATPTTIQLTPEQLEMLKGYNHITLSDGYGTIELKALTGANWS